MTKDQLETEVAVRVLLLKYGKLLLAKCDRKQGDPQSEHNKWALPGGSIAARAKLQAAISEFIAKKSGWAIDNIRLFRINVYSHDEGGQAFELVFIVDAAGKLGHDKLDVRLQRWFPLSALPEQDEYAYDHAETIRDLKKLLHSGKTLDLEHLPPVFSLRKRSSTKALDLLGLPS